MTDFLKRLVAFIGDAIARWIRTVTPAVLSYFMAKWPWLVDLFGDIDEQTAMLFVFSAYYTLVAVLETKVHPAFGWLLGKPKVPTP